jgi:hypothetical protein
MPPPIAGGDDDKRAARIAAATPISESTYVELRKKKNADDTDDAQMNRYELVKCYGDQHTIDAKFVREYGKPRVMEQHGTLLAYAQADGLQAERRQTLAADTLLRRRHHPLEAAMEYAKKFAVLDDMLKLLGVEFGAEFRAGTHEAFTEDEVKKLRRNQEQMRTVLGESARSRLQAKTTRAAGADVLQTICNALFPGGLLNAESPSAPRSRARSPRCTRGAGTSAARCEWC